MDSGRIANEIRRKNAQEAQKYRHRLRHDFLMPSAPFCRQPSALEK
jgi:hypothetical protein